MTVIHIANGNNEIKKYFINKFINKNNIKIIDLDVYICKILSKSESYKEYKISFKKKGLKTK
jgi:hypothetical protein